MSKEKPPSRDYEAEQTSARLAAVEAMKTFERAAWNAGFNEGFLEGWSAGRKYIEEAMAKASAPPEPPPARPQQGAAPALFAVEPPGAAVRAADIVFQVIKANPGIRGVEIVNATTEIGSPVIERTVRTALYRMKRDKRIKNLDGRWFTTDAAPASKGDGPGGENDG